MIESQVQQVSRVKAFITVFFLFAACKSNVEIGGMRKETVAKTTKQKVRLG